MSLLDALLLDPAPFNVWIAFRTDGIKGSGTASDPYDGSSQVKFDAIMSGFSSQSNMTIRLGPGEFETNGYNGTTGWHVSMLRTDPFSLTGIGVSKAYLGVDYHGPLPGSGTGCVVEGNALFDCEKPIYSDTGATRDSVIRDNYFSDVGQAVNFSYAGGPGSEDPRSAASLKRDVSNHKIAILEFATAHGLSLGQVVTIEGARIGNPPSTNNPYNGNHRIIAVSADNFGVIRFFSYEMKEVPNQDPDPSPPAPAILFRVRWQNPRHVFEGNCYDLYPYDQNSHLPSYGIGTYAYTGAFPFTVPAIDPYIFPGVIIRENVIRLRDGIVAQAAGNGAFGWACRLDSFENTLVENNVIDSLYSYPVHHLNSNSVTAFNNRTPAGTRLPIYNDTSGSGVLSSFRREDSLEDKIQDALLASLL